MSRWKVIGDQLRNQNVHWSDGTNCEPEMTAISRMAKYFLQVVFPNYYIVANGESIEDVLSRLHVSFATQIHRAVYHKCLEEGSDASRAHVEELADDMIRNLPSLQESLQMDVEATFKGDPAASNYTEIVLTYPGVLALAIYRLAHLLQNSSIPILPRMLTEYAHRVTGIDIHPGAKIGSGLMIDHGTGVVIGATAVIGRGVKIYQGVTIGALSFARSESGDLIRCDKRHPTIEDNVVLYAHATVLGGDTVIGHDSVVGANAWVTQSLPPYSKVRWNQEAAHISL